MNKSIGVLLASAVGLVTVLGVLDYVNWFQSMITMIIMII